MAAPHLGRLAVLALALGGGTAIAQTPVGDPMAGRALFIGARVFRGGGSPCGGCHAIGGESAPFAASLGPELSASLGGLDAAAVDGLLQDLPFPTMAPIYAKHALAPAERADLCAFLLQASGKPAPGGGLVALCAAIVAGAALAVLVIATRRGGRGSVRAELLAAARVAAARRTPARPGGDPPVSSRDPHGGAR
jgi:mono/diheme cytochrome c family protein